MSKKKVATYRVKKVNTLKRLSKNPKVLFLLLLLSTVCLTRYYYLQHLFDLRVEEEKVSWKQYLSTNVPAYNPSKYVGRGIVFTTYSPTVNITFASINILRDHGCALPVEIWHFDGLSPSEIKRLEEDTQTKVKSLTSFLNGESYQGILKTFSVTKRNYQVKTASIINSGFQEVLYMDSDNVALEDPTFLFDTNEYKETGALFWPDYFMDTIHPAMYNIFGIQNKHEWEQEAGQLLIDKARYFKVANTDNVSYPVALGSVWHALHLSLYMQNKNEFYFKLILGDKDTFRFGWEATKTPYHMVTHFPGAVGFNAAGGIFCGHTIIQYSTTKYPRKPLFMHINLLKQNPDSYRKRGSTFQTYKSYSPKTTFNRHYAHFGVFLRTLYQLKCVDFKDTDIGNGDGEVSIQEFGKGDLAGFEDRFFDLVAGKGVDIIRTEVPE